MLTLLLRELETQTPLEISWLSRIEFGNENIAKKKKKKHQNIKN